MFDPFGLRREIEEEEPPVAGAYPNPCGQRRFWVVLLVLDTIFILIFAVALAAMVYKHWSSPPQAGPMAQNRPGVRRSAGAKPQAPAPSTATAPTPPAAATVAGAPAPVPEKKEPPPKPEPKPIKPAESKGPIGSPSVLTPDLPRHGVGLAQPDRKLPNPPSAQTPEPPKSSEKPHAKLVVLTCPGADAQEVFLKGAFLVRFPRGEKKMTRDAQGTWKTTIGLLPGKYKYQCVVDGKKTKSDTIEVQ